MVTSSFDYYAPTSVADALALLDQHGDDAKLLAGGHSLIP
ncbi:MAG TPA: carbon monoxide dehydrogenase, partial [Dehalococcoidia bacterium]|nr:carbon monoxide dehydrogenase [Dehalococcoidia bacterium]